MAGPVIHLLAARAWAKGRPELIECAEFYLGAISPDAIHARPGTDMDDKRRTHLGNHGTFDLKPLTDYARARRSAFDVGYMTHLLTDPFWVASYRALPGLVDADGRTRREVYYPEMEKCERALLDEWLFALMQEAVVPEDHPFFSEDELTAWRDSVITHYGDGPRDAETNNVLTVSFVDDFVRRAGGYLEDMMRRLSL